MTEETEPTPAPPSPPPPASDPDPGDLHAASHAKIEGLEDQVAGVNDQLVNVFERLGKLEETTVSGEPERTEVVPRTEEPAAEKKEEPAGETPAEGSPSEKHTGLFF